MTTARDTLLAVIGTNRNGWMPGFGYTSHHLAKAIVNGHVTADDLTEFTPYDKTQAETLARKAGLRWHTDPETVDPVPNSGMVNSVDTEDISISVESILGLAGKPLEVEGQPWFLYRDGTGIEGQDTTEEALTAAAAGLDPVTAAQVLLDSDAYHSKHLVVHYNKPSCDCHDRDGKTLTQT